MKRGTLAAAVLSVALAGCGPEPTLSITLQPLQGGQTWNEWVFGTAFSCTTASTSTGRASMDGAGPCQGADPNANPCYVDHNIGLSLTKDFQASALKPNAYTVYAEQLDQSTNCLGWACAPATVKAGQAASVTLSFQAGCN